MGYLMHNHRNLTWMNLLNDKPKEETTSFLTLSIYIPISNPISNQIEEHSEEYSWKL